MRKKLTEYNTEYIPVRPAGKHLLKVSSSIIRTKLLSVILMMLLLTLSRYLPAGGIQLVFHEVYVFTGFSIYKMEVMKCPLFHQ